MLRPMFGIGGSEILVILIVALIFLGPEQLPDAATKISKAVRELRKQTREVQQTIENDTEIGGAIRDLKSALRGDEVRPKAKQALAPIAAAVKDVQDTVKDATKPAEAKTAAAKAEDAKPEEAAPSEPRIMPPAAGEPHDPDAPPDDEGDAEVAKLIKPATGTVAHGPSPRVTNSVEAAASAGSKPADGHG